MVESYASANPSMIWLLACSADQDGSSRPRGQSPVLGSLRVGVGGFVFWVRSVLWTFCRKTVVVVGGCCQEKDGRES